MVDQPVTSERRRAASALAGAALEPSADTARLDRLVREVVELTHATAGHVSMLTDRQVTASGHGASGMPPERGSEVPLEDSICMHTLRADDTLVIPDAGSDPRVSSLPIVAGGGISAYLGAPLRLPDGDMVGVLSVVDRDVRPWTDDHIVDVTRVAQEVVAELRRIAATDGSRGPRARP